ncbi:MAG: GNAT family N-acetyltransferase [Anaerolineae bacterium]|nr:GNAT family N-acetyltransferase [Anaerolineae bacterium]
MQKILPDGLILRSLSEGYSHDRDRLPSFYELVFGQQKEWQADGNLWIENMLSGDHPTVTDADCFVVVDPACDDRIVSATILIPQTWRYETVDLPAGRPEVVATHPDYRNRGLIRAVMDAVHERSAALGHNIQGITGIPHFYRKFGYVMAVDLGRHATVPLTSVPSGEPEQYTLRPVTEADFPLLDAWDRYVAPQFSLSVRRDRPALWKQVLFRPQQTLQVIEDTDGTGVGYVALHRMGESPLLVCLAYIVGNQASYLQTYDDVLRGIRAYAQVQYHDRMPIHIAFDSGQPEALTMLLDRTNAARVNRRHYAWYLRAASPARLMMDIKPVLQQRLLHSGAHRYTGELLINFFDLTGLRVEFDHGCIVQAEDLQLRTLAERDRCHAGVPWGTFLSIVFGYRTLDELQHVLPECFASAKAEVLLHTLFPVKPSRLLPVS